jgi:NAD(P)H-flavin reductase
MLPYKSELSEWSRQMDLELTVDEPQEGWEGHAGVVPKIVEELRLSADNSVAVICGPPIMIRYGREALERLGFSRDQIYTTLEMKMKCGVGICGRCNIDHRYICKDGPVFRMDEVPAELV